MPLYVYRCPQGHEFEDIQPVKEGETCICPTCGTLSTRTVTQANVKVIGGTPKFYHRRIG